MSFSATAARPCPGMVLISMAEVSSTPSCFANHLKNTDVGSDSFISTESDGLDRICRLCIFFMSSSFRRMGERFVRGLTEREAGLEHSCVVEENAEELQTFGWEKECRLTMGVLCVVP